MTLIIKFIGSLFVIFSATKLGLSIARNFRNRPLHLRQLQFSLQLMESEINYGATPLPEIWKKLENRMELPISRLFGLAYKNLVDGACLVSEAFDKALEQMVSDTSLLPSDIEIVKTLSASLGRSSREEQIKSIRLTMVELSVEEKKAEQERVQNERLWKYLGFLTGMMLVIVLL